MGPKRQGKEEINGVRLKIIDGRIIWEPWYLIFRVWKEERKMAANVDRFMVFMTGRCGINICFFCLFSWQPVGKGQL